MSSLEKIPNPPHTEEKPVEKSADIESLPRAECVVILGRGIERVTTVGAEKWKPSRYVQDVRNEADGSFIRTGHRKPLADPENENTRATGGGNANTLAALEFFKEAHQVGIKPKLLIFAAGRPGYLASEDENLTEGTVMQEILRRRVPELPETVILDKNKNTRDDIFTALTVAIARGLKSVVFINTEINMERAKDFYRKIIREKPEFASIQVHFLDSEMLLTRRYAKHPARAKEFEELLNALRTSKARARTDEMEQGGRNQISDGTYDTRGKT